MTGEELGWWRLAGSAGLVGLNEVKYLRSGDDLVDGTADLIRHRDDLPNPVY